MKVKVKVKMKEQKTVKMKMRMKERKEQETVKMKMKMKMKEGEEHSAKMWGLKAIYFFSQYPTNDQIHPLFAAKAVKLEDPHFVLE